MEQAPVVNRYWTWILAGYRSLQENRQRIDNTGAIEYEILSFFTFANHLREYLIFHQPGISRKAVSDFVNTEDALAMCSDIANATKHVRITQGAPRSNVGGTRPEITQGLLVGLSTDGSPAKLKIVRSLIFEGRASIDADELALAVLAAWQKFGLGINPDWIEEVHR